MDHMVTADENGMRLRDLLRRCMNVSYSAMKSAKWDDRIMVDGVPTPVDRFVAVGQVVSFLPKDEVPVYALKPYVIPLTIPYIDDNLMIVDKSAPLASQSSLNHPDDSLENAVFAYFGCPASYIYRPVNRLDKGTSGLMVIARGSHSQYLLQHQLHTADFRRIYLAVTDGVPECDEGVIDKPIAKANGATVRRMIDPAGKPSVTHYRVLKKAHGRALLRLELETGRTHQIRVHLSSIGCSVFGDFLYGRESDALPGRFALHSAELYLRHPLTGEMLHLTSPLPDALSALLPD